MRPLQLSPSALADLFFEARATWPAECCGVIVGLPDAPQTARFQRFDNLADRLHALDPERYPRDAQTAYSLDPLKLERFLDQAASQGEILLAICHSHPQHPAYFSATDRAAASPFGAPTWPHAAQIVVSVYEREVADAKAFGWDGADWVERAIADLPELPGPPPGATIYGDV